jgi:hypothetical protein
MEGRREAHKRRTSDLGEADHQLPAARRSRGERRGDMTRRNMRR